MIKDKLNENGDFCELPKGDMSPIEEPLVKRMLKLCKEGTEKFSQRRAEIISILSALEAADLIKEFDSDGNTYMYGKIIKTVVDSFLDKSDFLNWNLSRVEQYGKPAKVKDMSELALMAGRKMFQEVLEEGGYNKVMGQEQFGMQREIAVKGDCFVLVSAKDGGIEFQNLYLDDVKLPRNAVDWDDVLHNYQEMTLLFNVDDWDQFKLKFEDEDGVFDLDKIVWGDMPSTDTDSQMYGDKDNKNRNGQYAVYLSWRKGYEAAVWIAGSNATIFREYYGKDAPDTCPVFRYKFSDSFSDFWAKGVTDAFYQSNGTQQFNFNNKIMANQNAAREYNILSVGSDRKINAEQMILDMEESRQEGRVSFGIMERNGQGDDFSVSTIGGNAPALQESYALDSMLDKITVEEGITLQDTGAEKGKPLGSFQLELENANRKARKVGSRNAPELKRMLEYAFDLMIDSISASDKTPINLDENEIDSDDIKVDIGSTLARVGMTNVTRGDAKKFLKEFKPYIEVDSLSGAVSNPILEINKHVAAMNLLGGTAYDAKIRQKIAKEFGYKAKEAEMMQVNDNEQPQVQNPMDMSVK